MCRLIVLVVTVEPKRLAKAGHCCACPTWAGGPALIHGMFRAQRLTLHLPFYASDSLKSFSIRRRVSLLAPCAADWLVLANKLHPVRQSNDVDIASLEAKVFRI